MSEIQPPPKIVRPHIDMELSEGIDMVIEGMEGLADWMFETAQWIESKTNEDAAQ